MKETTPAAMEHAPAVEVPSIEKVTVLPEAPPVAVGV